MEDTTLLKYLTSPNPSLDCTNSSTGTNTLNAKWDAVTGLKEWTEFNYETWMQIYGPILQQSIPAIAETNPPLTMLERQIFTERTFETILDRAIMPEVSAALRVAWPRCYANDKVQDIAEIGKGDKARRGTMEEDDRYYADWAGIRQGELTNFGYKNLCPGETKLASKWSTSSEGRRRTDYIYPFNQIQTYCGRQWGSRYGYIITPDELVVVRVSRELISPGLAVSRSVRDVSRQATSQALHSRTFSTETVRSELQAMSLDTGSAFSDDANPNIEYGPLLFKSIPWSAVGVGVLTVKLALWCIHMETKKDISVQHNYPPLRSIGEPSEVLPSTEVPETLLLPGSAQYKTATKNQNQSAGKKKK